MERFDDATAAYEDAIKVEPGVAANYLHAPEAWRAAKNDARAIQYLEKTIQIDPMIPEAYGELARLYSSFSQPDMVLQTWERFVKVFPMSIEGRAALRRAGNGTTH